MFKLDELLNELVKLETLNTELLEALKANMKWIGPPPVDRHSYDNLREDAWVLGKAAIAKAEGNQEFNAIVRMGGREFAMTIKGGTMKRDELYAKYIGVMNINAVLKQQNSELLEALKDFYAFKTKGYDQDVEPYNKECPVCHSDKPYHNGLCPKYKVDQAIAKAEGKT